MRRRKRDSDGKRSVSGFTLLEVMVALGLLAFGLLSIAAAQLGALRQSSRSKNLTHAMHLAQQQVEVFTAMGQSNLPADGTYNDANNPIASVESTTDQSTFNRRWTIASNSPLAGITAITVEVDWVDQLGSTRTTRLRTMSGM
jgi:type IV pilus assembly protein PilV